MYWNINQSWSYNCLFNFIVGTRGVGKTYGCKKKAIQRFLKSGEEFVYIRRYREELNKVLPHFFDDIEEAFPEHEFKADHGLFMIDGEVAGYGIPLSTGKINKSIAYPHVSYIIFDEFILDSGYHHYIKDEITAFLELYHTISRDRDAKVYFLSNAITETNPYFLYFNLRIPKQKPILAKGDVLIENSSYAEFTQHMKETRIGKLLKDTDYGKYAYDNIFLRDNEDFIKKKTGNCNYMFTIKFAGKTYGCWWSQLEQVYYISFDIEAQCGFVYSLTLDDFSPNTVLIHSFNRTLLNHLFKMYLRGCVYYESMTIKNQMRDAMRLFVK